MMAKPSGSFCGGGANVHIYAVDHEWALQVGYRFVFLEVDIFAGHGEVQAGFSRAKRVKLWAFLFVGE